MRPSQYFQNILPFLFFVSGSVIPRDTFDPDNPEESNPTTPPQSLNRPSRPQNPYAEGFKIAPSSCTNFMKPSEQCITDLQAQPGGVVAFSGGEIKWDSNHKCDDTQKAKYQTSVWDAIALAIFADRQPDAHNVHDLTLWKTWIGPDYATQQERISNNLKRAGQFYSNKGFDIILTCSDPQDTCRIQKDGKNVGGYAWTYHGWFGYKYYYINMCAPFFKTDDLMYKVDQIEEELGNGNTEKARKAEWQKNTGQMFLHEMMHLESVGDPHITDERVDPELQQNWAYGPSRVHQLARRKLNQGGGAKRASTNADSYAWLANSKYWYDLTGYFPAPPNYKASDDSFSDEEQDGFLVDFGVVTESTQDIDIEERLNNIISGFGSPDPAPKPGKSLSIAMVSIVNSHSGFASTSSRWEFFTTPVGKAVGSCGETEGEKLTPEEGSTDVTLSADLAERTENPPWPAGTYKLKIEGEECEYKNNGQNPGRLFCPQKQIGCREDEMKSQEDGSLRCGSRGFFHAVVYCDF